MRLSMPVKVGSKLVVHGRAPSADPDGPQRKPDGRIIVLLNLGELGPGDGEGDVPPAHCPMGGDTGTRVLGDRGVKHQEHTAAALEEYVPALLSAGNLQTQYVAIKPLGGDQVIHIEARFQNI